MNKYIFCFIALTFIASCSPQDEQSAVQSRGPKVVKAGGVVVSIDSMKPAVIVTVDYSKLIRVPVNKLSTVNANTNIYPAEQPNRITAGKPIAFIPGTNTIPLPEILPAIHHPQLAGIPEVVYVKDAYIKDQNPQNFSSFGKLQGLKSNGIRSMMNDKYGNLWIGTTGGGMSRYDGQRFTHYTEQEGLVHNFVSSMLEDRYGNLWFGTAGGVSKYDGLRFTNFTEEEGLTNSNVVGMIEDHSGNLWFASDGGGVIKYDGKHFIHFTEKQGLGNNHALCILEDRSGNIWIGTIDGGVSKYDGKQFVSFSDKHGMPDKVVVSILEDHAGNIWLGTDGYGVSKYDGISFTNYSVKEGLSNNSVWSILEDKSGNFWFGTNGGGLNKFDGKQFTHYSEQEGLNNDIVFCGLEDYCGNLWFGTNGGGICKYDGRLFTHLTEKEGMSDKAIWNIIQDNSGNLWFGTGSNGAVKYDGKQYTTISDSEGLSANYVRTILEDHSGNLWFGTFGGGVNKYDGRELTIYMEDHGLSNRVVSSCIEDHHGNLWFGTYGGGVSKFDGKIFTHFTEEQGLINNAVNCILEDHSGNLWFGTFNSGLSKFDGKRFTNFTTDDGLNSNTIWSIKEDASGAIWLATGGGGVCKFDGKNFTHFTEKEGLPSNFVLSVLKDHTGSLWFGTRFGLSKLLQPSADNDSGFSIEAANKQNVYFKNYIYEDGFLGIGCYHNAIFEDDKNQIWVGANDRLTVYHPEIKKTVIHAPEIQITGIDLFNVGIPWLKMAQNTPAGVGGNVDTSFTLENGVRIENFKFDRISKWYGVPENLNLSYKNNNLTFQFIGITMKSPKKVKYQYKLEGIDHQWSAISNRSEASYVNLTHGSYVFKVKAMNESGQWSNEAHYAFTIRPPWWKTWWAYSIYIIILIGSISYYIKWRERSLKERQKILEQTVKVRTAEVVAEKEEVEKQRQRSDQLLLNILPEEVAEELKAKGYADARQFDEVTVLFTDFKGFTNISEKLTPSELVEEIHTCFKAFDQIITKHNVEKIKTIGDSYMCAGGLPVANKTNASDVVHAALEIQKFMLQHLQERKEEGKETFEIRIGINTGPVVAGIVGVKKFAYDIWGDTVNTASRMESSGETGKINISNSTYELIKNQFKCVARGKVQAKNKGEIEMYFVEEEF